STYISQLNEIGMVTDAVWSDYDNDGDLDLLLVGEWMPIVLFENRGNFFQRQFNVEGLERSEGWWRSLFPYDINGDGLTDYIAGNLGTNSMFKTEGEQVIRLFINDYDLNGSMDHIYTYREGEHHIPFHTRDQLSARLDPIGSHEA
ncbi:MAG TPA: FG-GAP-like repeat-containing protein, partial [Arenicellales bacterium]|nr:FG-GAP-like repeat-containing protein [Arenicellales bacterium]